MASLRDIKKRIDAVQSTKQITRTMEMIASAKIRKAMDKMSASSAYSEAITEMMGKVCEQSALSGQPLLESHETLRRAIVVAIVSDKGLAGAFNSSVLRHCDALISRLAGQGAEVSTIACGKKAIAYFQYRKYDIVREYRDMSSNPTVDQAREIATMCSHMFTSGEADEVYVCYNHAKNMADQQLREFRMLPIETASELEDDASEAAEAAASAGEGGAHADGAAGTGSAGGAAESGPRGGFEFEPDADDVLKVLLPAFVNTRVYNALVDSAAAEQAARRKSMKIATDNATDMIESLSRIYNRARQGAITTELTEIVAGAAGSGE